MLALILIASIIGYLTAAAWTFGYVRGAVNDHENGWETPLPLFSAIFWPITILAAMVIMPVQKAGFAFQQHKLEQQKQRIALQEKVRIELQEAEKELEAQFEQLAEDEAHEELEQSKKRRTVEKTARAIDSYLFDKPKKSRKRSA